MVWSEKLLEFRASLEEKATVGSKDREEKWEEELKRLIELVQAQDSRAPRNDEWWDLFEHLRAKLTAYIGSHFRKPGQREDAEDVYCETAEKCRGAYSPCRMVTKALRPSATSTRALMRSMAKR